MRHVYNSRNTNAYGSSEDVDETRYEKEQGTLPTSPSEDERSYVGMQMASNGETNDEQNEFHYGRTNRNGSSRSLNSQNVGKDANGDDDYGENEFYSGDETDFHGSTRHDDDDRSSIRVREQMTQEVLSKVKTQTTNVTYWRILFFISLLLNIVCSSVLSYFALNPIQEECSSNESNNSVYHKSNEETATNAKNIAQALEKRFNQTNNEMIQLSEFLSAMLVEVQDGSQDDGTMRHDIDDIPARDSISPGGILTWPFVTMPAFSSYASSMIQKASSNSLSIIPVLRPKGIWGWNAYSVMNQGWTMKALLKQNNTKNNDGMFILNQVYELGKDANEIINVTEQVADAEKYPVAPIWQTYPLPSIRDVNFNVLSRPGLQSMYDAIIEINEKMNTTTTFLGPLIDGNQRYSNWIPSHYQRKPASSSQASSVLVLPVFAFSNASKSDMVAMIALELDWKKLIVDNMELPSEISATVVVQNTCGQSQTFYLPSKTNTDNESNEQGIWGDYSSAPLGAPGYVVKFNNVGMPTHKGACTYSALIYPTISSETIDANNKQSNIQIAATIVVAITYVLALATFLMYDMHSSEKNDIIVKSAADSKRIISNLFPNTVRHRLFDNDANEEQENDDMAPVCEQLASTKHRRHSMAGNFSDIISVDKTFDVSADDDDDTDEVVVFKTKPIADLFPEVTILFADMVGFTAWSSSREPTQVFTLLESLYHAFDQIARKRRVFKVETIGDCYVAVAGLPDPRTDHATVMCRFANDCLKKVHVLTKKLVVVLGPDTENLTMRGGLHSGPVTAGVLRGERSRFQLFGDTVNTASRMESTGLKDRIQISQETADRLIAGGKVHWLAQREDKVIAKGKGEVESYWLQIDPQVTPISDMMVTISPLSRAERDFHSHEMSGEDASIDSSEILCFSSIETSPRKQSAQVNVRLVDWNVELLLRQLKLIAASRRKSTFVRQASFEGGPEKTITESNGNETTVLDEVCEVIRLPNFNPKYANNLQTSDATTLAEGVEDELRDYITRIARMYRKNPFHNFEHASHVTMSVSKLLSRIVKPSQEVVTSDDTPGTEKKKTASELHCFSYGITSDPLTQFACLFSALIHDVDHTGIPNAAIIEENPALAQKYKWRSVAEQNSVDQSWNLLLEDDFKNLRQAIYSNQDELQRFRSLVVNLVMATDIMDKDLKQLRNSRWDKAFTKEPKQQKKVRKDNFNRKATVVIEHLIQASDVAHTMQHWHIYRKWNERLFSEMLKAYRMGRSEYDPTTNWYEGELGFFDHYIIPLAKKLKECGVFGVSSDEYLDYALHNRNEFAERGKELIEEMIQKQQN